VLLAADDMRQAGAAASALESEAENHHLMRGVGDGSLRLLRAGIYAE